jgi:hypothetical protein
MSPADPPPFEIEFYADELGGMALPLLGQTTGAPRRV